MSPLTWRKGEVKYRKRIWELHILKTIREKEWRIRIQIYEEGENKKWVERIDYSIPKKGTERKMIQNNRFHLDSPFQKLSSFSCMSSVARYRTEFVSAAGESLCLSIQAFSIFFHSFSPPPFHTYPFVSSTLYFWWIWGKRRAEMKRKESRTVQSRWTVEIEAIIHTDLRGDDFAVRSSLPTFLPLCPFHAQSIILQMQSKRKGKMWKSKPKYWVGHSRFFSFKL